MFRKLRIFFYMFDLVGPQNACIGLGQALQARGHEIYFVTNEKFGAKFAKYGFKSHFLKEAPSTKAKPVDPKENPIQRFTNKMADAGFFSNLSSLEKMQLYKKGHFFDGCVEKNAALEPQLKELFERERPDFLIIDQDVVAPFLLNPGIPWAFLFCAQPLGFFDSLELPPFTSGYPVNGDRIEWKEFRKVQQTEYLDMTLNCQRELCEMFGYRFDEKQKYLPHSPYLNIYQYPKELDYHNLIHIPDNFFRVDTFCREESEPFKLPEEFTQKMGPGDKLIYLSLGSMGSIDVKLMTRLVTILGRTRHFYIVSQGMLHDQYELEGNMWGGSFIPQIQILPLVDLVITHGGNCTVTEAFSHGKPMIVLPLYYDQFDNAQRLSETGFGVRIEPYAFEDCELVEAIDQLLGDRELKLRLDCAVERIRTDNTNSKVALCERIEQIVAKSEI